MGDVSLGQLVAGRYQLVGLLGEGSFGVVYDAVHQVIGRRVAIKILRDEIGREPELVHRFQLEARAAGALGHPNIVQIFDAGQVDGGPHYLVMERVEGPSLAAELARSGPLEISRAVDLAVQVLSGLAAAHRRSIVHRDLKPENILLGRDEEGREVAKIADFGISKVLDPKRLGVATDLRMTGHGEVIGTPLYMAPEQAAGEADIDQRADLWAVGCVLYEMVCGRPPFRGESYPQILAALLRDPPLMPGTLRPEVAPALEAVIMAALQKEPVDRPMDALAMRDMLVAASRKQAAAPVAADDAAMVAALSRAVALELAEGGGGGLPPAPEPAAPPVEMELAAPEPVRPRGPAPDAFAPPELGAAAALALDVDRSALRTSQRQRVLDGPATIARAPAAVRRGARLPLGGLFTFLVVGGLLAAGGLAGYRYLTLGYVWRPTSGLIVELAVTPPEAEVTLDGEPLVDSRFTIEEGRAHELVARAPGRLAVRRELRAAREMSRRLEVRLPSALRPLAGEVAPITSAAAPPPPSGGAAAIDQALGKLDLYRGCLALVGPDLRAARDAYQESAGGAPAVRPLTATEIDQCRADAERAARLAPSLGAVDAAAAGFIDALVDVDARSRRLATYYQTGEHRADGRRFGKKSHEPLVRAYALALARAGELGDLVERATGDWQAQELDLVRERDLEHGMLRRLALAARRRARAEIRSGAEDRAAALAGLDRALADLQAQPPRPGPAAEVVALAAAPPAAGDAPEAWVAWHDRLVTAFNRIETR